MPTKVRINLANQRELLELPGLRPQQAEAIVRYRAEHGPIKDARELSAIVGAPSASDPLWERADFSPADATAPEAPGA
jgi:competence ComEA-like helix-hairpin-helix protein